MESLVIILTISFLGLSSTFQGHLFPSFTVPHGRNRATKVELSFGLATTIDTTEKAQRDIPSLGEWAARYGIQTSDGFELISEDGQDVYAVTSRDLPAESPILFVPHGLILTAYKAREELGDGARAAEKSLLQSDALDDLPQFYLFLKLLKEYELGMESPWYHWLNSTPRFFSNGASMTDFCFGCLPPYAAGLALEEKKRLNQFIMALDDVPFIGQETRKNIDITRWAFSVVSTRSLDMPGGSVSLIPMADYFNHRGGEADVYITNDAEGNCFGYATRDLPAGSPLKICYGDPTNPSKLLARFGFLDESSPATFCKYIIENPPCEVLNMGYPTSMLFYQNGGIAQEVWDILLYQELGKVSFEQQQAFYNAYMTGDRVSMQRLHKEYFSKTYVALQEHVNYILNELQELGFGLEAQTMQGQDAELHPRLPLLTRHNEIVKNTFEIVKKNLNNMMLS